MALQQAVGGGSGRGRESVGVLLVLPHSEMADCQERDKGEEIASSLQTHWWSQPSHDRNDTLSEHSSFHGREGEGGGEGGGECTTSAYKHSQRAHS